MILSHIAYFVVKSWRCIVYASLATVIVVCSSPSSKASCPGESAGTGAAREIFGGECPNLSEGDPTKATGKPAKAIESNRGLNLGHNNNKKILDSNLSSKKSLVCPTNVRNCLSVKDVGRTSIGSVKYQVIRSSDCRMLKIKYDLTSCGKIKCTTVNHNAPSDKSWVLIGGVHLPTISNVTCINK